MTRNEFNLLYAIKKHGTNSSRKLKDAASVSVDFVSQKMKLFKDKGLIDENGITNVGLEELKPYKVENAVIMAAGMSSRFVPLSLEKPKGLLEVRGEVLIERQIKQLKAAGIDSIILVLGYKKEAFFYLEDKFDDIRIIINPEYNTKNNTHTIYIAQEFISNSYICSSDNYFAINPFEEYVYQSYYAAQYVNGESSEWFMQSDSKGNILKVEKGGADGSVMLGHVYWDREFASAMLKYVNRSHETGEYDQELWEQILLENVKTLPPMYINTYPDGAIFEFDSLDELRAFDSSYVHNTHSRIMRNICKVLECDEGDVVNFQAIKDGSTNNSFVFEVNEHKYVYRHSGDGTESIISREHEKNYVEGIRTPDYSNSEDS